MTLSYIEIWRAKISMHSPLITPGSVKTFLVDWAFSTHKAEKELGNILDLSNFFRNFPLIVLLENKSHISILSYASFSSGCIQSINYFSTDH